VASAAQVSVSILPLASSQFEIPFEILDVYLCFFVAGPCLGVFVKSCDENCDKWLCASSAMECSAITGLSELPRHLPVTCLVSCTEGMFDFILAFPIATTGSLFTMQTKCCLCCFLCGRGEGRSNM